MKTIIKNIGLLATPQGKGALKGKEQGKITLLRDAYIMINNKQIVAVGAGGSAEARAVDGDTQVIDARGSLVTPGLIDAHTHLIFRGWRQQELALKLRGFTYLDILKQGGGILCTMNGTRQATLNELVAAGKQSLAVMLAHGTTTCEVKSGYGLTVEDEIKSLFAVRELQAQQPVDLAPTFMGAHAVPPEYKDRKQEYVKLVCNEMIPAVAHHKLAEFCDVFCEDSVFDLAESRAILACGKRYGLSAKIHADEITFMGGATLAAEVGAITAEHLIHASDDGLAKMALAQTIAVLLPGTSFYLNEDFARARTMVNLGIPVAVATDFNPGSCPTESLQLPMNLACLKYRLTPEEALTAVTLNAAAAINRGAIVGSLEVGKQADIVIWNAPDLEFIFYHWGVNLVCTVIKNGAVVVSQ
jgi:imidazolonepropionase